jgi:hypothetical protein
MNILKNILRPIYNHPSVFFIRGIFFDIYEFLSDYSVERKRFKEKMGYDLDLKNPRTFSHRIVYKKIYDRNPVLPKMADKYLAREYLIDRFGDFIKEFLVPLLFVTDNPSKIPFDSIEGNYIVKVNHNSGPHFIVRKGQSINKEEIINSLKKQLRYPYGTLKHEWAYGKIKKRLIVVEKLLEDKDGNIPRDFKFHMINGKCAFIQVDFDRFIDHSRSLYDENWNFIEGTLKFKQGIQINRPTNLNLMLDLARKISSGFDYLRVDLYDINERVYIGELTHYPGSGMEVFTPESMDYKFGDYFKDNESKNKK